MLYDAVQNQESICRFWTVLMYKGRKHTKGKCQAPVLNNNCFYRQHRSQKGQLELFLENQQTDRYTGQFLYAYIFGGIIKRYTKQENFNLTFCNNLS